MYTLAEAEYVSKDLAKAVRDAEKKYGFKTGLRRAKNKVPLIITVKVEFYPKTKFYAVDMVEQNGKFLPRAKPRELTRVLYNATEEYLKLS